MRHRRFELAAWITLEVGKPWSEADADVSEAIDFCKYYGQQIQRLEETGKVFRTLTVVAPAGGVVMKRMPGLEGRAVTPRGLRRRRRPSGASPRPLPG